MLAQVDNTDTSAQPRETPFRQLLNSAFSLQPLQLPPIKLQPSVILQRAAPG